jgi:hypothetical protein
MLAPLARHRPRTTPVPLPRTPAASPARLGHSARHCSLRATRLRPGLAPTALARVLHAIARSGSLASSISVPPRCEPRPSAAWFACRSRISVTPPARAASTPVLARSCSRAPPAMHMLLLLRPSHSRACRQPRLQRPPRLRAILPALACPAACAWSGLHACLYAQQLPPTPEAFPVPMRRPRSPLALLPPAHLAARAHHTRAAAALGFARTWPRAAPAPPAPRPSQPRAAWTPCHRLGRWAPPMPAARTAPVLRPASRRFPLGVALGRALL